MTSVPDGDLICPKCGHSSPPKSDYCWECRFDFVPDDRLKATRRPVPIPPPYSTSRPDVQAAKPARERVSLTALLLELLVSTLIVGGSWFLFAAIFPSLDVIKFAAGWAAALVLVVVSEGHVPDVESDVSKYWSLNPFEFSDDRNRRVLNWHIAVFLPRIVLRTIQRTFAVLSGAH